MEQIERENLYQERLERDRWQVNRDTLKKEVEEIVKIEEIVQEIKAFEVTILLRFILILSIIADLFGLIPIVGNIFAIFFGIIFFILYFINGQGRGMVKGVTRSIIRKKGAKLTKKGAKWVRRVFFSVAEVTPLGIFPLFTIMALIEIVLSQRKVAKLVNKIEKIRSKIK